MSTGNSGRGRRSRGTSLFGVWAVAVVGAASLVGLGGCQSISEEEYRAAIDENRQLRERLTGVGDEMGRLEGENRALAAENQQLAATMSQLQNQVNERPAQPAPAARASGFENIEGTTVSRGSGTLTVAVAGDVLFASGSAELKGTARQTLDQVARVLQSQYASNTIRVEGHTDSDAIRKSKWADNEHLSAERALAVERYLVSKGVDRDRIYSAAFADAVPRGTKAQSRRVEIVIHSGPR